MDVKEQVEALARPITLSLGMELVEVEYKREGRKMVLRLYIDKPGGVSLDDCADVSREIAAVLDVDDVIPARYTLEVSSPGLNRPLKTRSHYEAYAGRLVKIKTFEMLPDDAGNLRKTFLGELLGMEGDMIRLMLREGQNASIPLSAVAKAHLEFEI